MNDPIPSYQHDCKKCIFLGDTLASGNVVDLYFCPGEITVIARYSSEPSDYSSGIVFAVNGHIAELVVARQRAIERGLLSPDIKS